MTGAQIVVTLAGIGLSTLIIWYFFFSTREGVRVSPTGKYQDVSIIVKGGYNPDVIIVERGKPVRLNFKRQETATCSEMVVFPEFNKSAVLPAGETVAVELIPEKAGEYEFSCQMGMLRGKLIVE